MSDQPGPRIRWTSEQWDYRDYDKGEIKRRTCYEVQNCDDEAIKRLLDLAEARCFGGVGKRLKSRTYKHFDRYPERIAVTAIYEVNP